MKSLQFKQFDKILPKDIANDFQFAQGSKYGIYKSEKSVGTTELHYSTKKRYHVLTILKSFFLSDTRQSMKRRIATER